MSLAITNSFVPHTDIKAEDVNQNFTDIQTAFNNLATWTTYTPTWSSLSGTVPNFGSSAILFKWARVGNIILVTGAITFAGATFGDAGQQWRFSLPVTPSAVSTSNGIMRCVDTGSGDILMGIMQDGAVGYFFAENFRADVYSSYLSATHPFTWANGDQLVFSFWYPVA